MNNKKYVEYDASKIKITDEMKEKDKECESLVKHCEMYIPEGIAPPKKKQMPKASDPS